MSAIKDSDILNFLDGTSSEEKNEEIKAWMKSDKSNRQHMKDFNTLVKELPMLDSFNLVSEDAEWKQFLEKTSPDLSELQILHHLDGLSNYSDKKNMDTWVSSSADNQKDMDVYNLIIQEAPHLSTYKMTNDDLEWNSFRAGIKEKSGKEATVVSLHQPSQSKARIFPMWQKMAAAAAFALLIISIWVMRPQEKYAEFVTGDKAETIQMIDGSNIELAANSKLRYPKNLKNLNERRLYLSGRGKFEVAKNQEKPFVVEVNDLIGVEVIGTIFKLDDNSDFIEVVENIEGKVRAFVLTDPANAVILEAGDRFGYNGTAFVDMNVVPEIDNAREYQILYVLDYLMEHSGWKVISSPYTDFVEDGVVMVDLEQPYDKILLDLVDRADFAFEKLPCEGCFIIQKFKPLEN